MQDGSTDVNFSLLKMQDIGQKSAPLPRLFAFCSHLLHSWVNSVFLVIFWFPLALTGLSEFCFGLGALAQQQTNLLPPSASPGVGHHLDWLVLSGPQLFQCFSTSSTRTGPPSVTGCRSLFALSHVCFCSYAKLEEKKSYIAARVAVELRISGG